MSSDENGVLAASFQPDARKLAAVQIGGPSTVSTRKHDANGVWQAVFDPVKNAIRVVIAG